METKTHMTVGAYIIHDNKVLLIHHKKLDIWIPPGGHIDENETPDEALKRELKEELNMEIEILNRNDLPLEGNIKKQLAIPFYVNVHNVGDHDHCCLFYVCKPKTLQIKVNEKELNNFGWFSKEELNQKHIPADVRNASLNAFDLYQKLEK